MAQAANSPNVSVLRGHKKRIYCIQQYGDALYSASADKTVRRWNLMTKECEAVFESHKSDVFCLQVFNGLLFTGSRDRTARAFTLDGKKVAKFQKVGATEVHALQCISRDRFQKGGQHSASSTSQLRLFTGHEDGHVREWDVSTGACIRAMRHANNGPIRSIDVRITASQSAPHAGQNSSGVSWGAYAASDTLVAGCNDGSALVFNLATGMCSRVIDAKVGRLLCLQRTAGSHIAYAGGSRRDITCIDLARGVAVGRLVGHSGPVTSLATYTVAVGDWQGHMLVSTSADRTCRLWDASTGNELGSLLGHGDWVRRAIVTENSESIISCSDDCTIRIASLADTIRLRPQRKTPAVADPISAAAAAIAQSGEPDSDTQPVATTLGSPSCASSLVSSYHSLSSASLFSTSSVGAGFCDRRQHFSASGSEFGSTFSMSSSVATDSAFSEMTVMVDDTTSMASQDVDSEIHTDTDFKLVEGEYEIGRLTPSIDGTASSVDAADSRDSHVPEVQEDECDTDEYKCGDKRDSGISCDDLLEEESAHARLSCEHKAPVVPSVDDTCDVQHPDVYVDVAPDDHHGVPVPDHHGHYVPPRPASTDADSDEGFEDELLALRCKFSSWTSFQRARAIRVLVGDCSMADLSRLYPTLQSLIQRDFIACLPYELAVKILSMLDAQDLCRAALVSKQWRSMANDPFVWRQLCVRQEAADASVSPDVARQRLRTRGVVAIPRHPASMLTSLASGLNVDRRVELCGYANPYKKRYADSHRLVRNWKDGRYHVRVLEGHLGPVQALQYDDKAIVTASEDSTIKVWDMETGRCLTTLYGHTRPLTDVCFRRDTPTLANDIAVGGLIVSASLDSTVRAWDLSLGLCIGVLRGHEQGVCTAQIDDAGTVYSGSYDRTVKLWKRNTAAAAATPSDAAALAMSVAVRGMRGEDDSGGFQCVATLRGHGHYVYSVRVAADIFATASHDRTVRVWDKKTLECLRVLSGHESAVKCLSFGPESSGERLRRVKRESERRKSSLGGAVSATAATPGTIGVDGAVAVATPTPSGSTTRMPVVYVTPGMECVISGSFDRTDNIRVWDLLSNGRSEDVGGGQCELSVTCRNDWTRCVAMDARFIVSGGDDATIKICDRETGEPVHTLAGHESMVTCLQFDRSKIVSASFDKTVRVWAFDA
eukprot:Opistho-2@10777